MAPDDENADEFSPCDAEWLDRGLMSRRRERAVVHPVRLRMRMARYTVRDLSILKPISCPMRERR